MSDSKRFGEIDRLFQEVCDLPPDQRQAKLIELAPTDAALRSEVIELLEADSRAGSLTPESLQPEIHRALGVGDTDPTEIAGYRVLTRLGEGGMGVVYEAEQRSPRRTVALKVLKPGLATPALVRRFEFESEALGRLRHPGIAQVFEAGVAETPIGPRPYFAMELIRGESLDRWADRTGASIRDRLDMLSRICDAVQHAHARGVVHRDLKPANILVTTEGDPKVLDFGVARLAHPDPDSAGNTIATAAGQLVGTVPYMSPEQLGARPESLDTRSDVYTLGVVLFRLLSNRLPHDVDDAALLDAARIVREEEPTRLATLEPRLRGDIDTIVRTALAKDPERRYQTAAAMADDIRRHLAGQTIAARPASAVYQLSRLARRHKPVVAALAALVAVTVGAIVGISLALAEATTQRDNAEQQASIARAVTDFLNNDVLSAVAPSSLGENTTVREALDSAAASLPGRFQDQPVTGAAIRNNIANLYSVLGRFAEAEPLTAEALETFTQELGRDDPLTQLAGQDLGVVYRDTGRYELAREQLLTVLADRERSVGPTDEATLENLVMLAELEQMGFADMDRAREWLGMFEARRAGVLADDHPTAAYAELVRGGIALELRDYQTAYDAYVSVAERREAEFGDIHPATITARHNIATALEGLARYDEAEPIYLANLETLRKTSGPDNPDVLVAAHNLAFLYQSMGRFDEAEPMFYDTLERCRRVFGPAHIGTLTCSQSLASLYRETGRDSEAITVMLEAKQAAQDAAEGPSPMLTEVTANLGIALADAERFAEAIVELEQAEADARVVFPDEHPLLGNILSGLGWCEVETGDLTTGRDTLREAHRRLAALPGPYAQSAAASAARRLVRAAEREGDTADAEYWRPLAGPDDDAAAQ
ncbi:MAG: serine/threonine-protein kinase [Planctomycetota bacterium]